MNGSPFPPPPIHNNNKGSGRLFRYAKGQIEEPKVVAEKHVILAAAGSGQRSGFLTGILCIFIFFGWEHSSLTTANGEWYTTWGDDWDKEFSIQQVPPQHKPKQILIENWNLFYLSGDSPPLLSNTEHDQQTVDGVLLTNGLSKQAGQPFLEVTAEGKPVRRISVSSMNLFVLAGNSFSPPPLQQQTHMDNNPPPNRILVLVEGDPPLLSSSIQECCSYNLVDGWSSTL